MEGERILKSLLNGETDGLYEDTKVGIVEKLVLTFNNFSVFSKCYYMHGCLIGFQNTPVL